MKFSLFRLGMIVVGLLLAVDSMVTAGWNVAPGALSILDSGEVLILDAHHGIFHYLMGSRRVAPLVQGFGLYDGVELGVAPVGGVESIFVSKRSRSESVGARVARYDLVGKLKGEWILPPWKGECSGVAIDPQAPVAYVASTQTGEIFKLDLRKSGRAAVPIAKISEAEVLGPMIFDGSRKQLLVADASRGTIFTVAIDSGRSEVLLKNLGEPSALALDSNADQLFIADLSGRRVLIFDLGRKETKPRIFIENIGEPTGLALTKDGGLWVGDLKKRALFLVSREGRVVLKVGL